MKYLNTTSTGSEKKLEEKLRKEVKKIGGLALKFASAYYTGLPDRFILMPGNLFYLAEIKSRGKILTEKQEARVKRVRNMGFTVFIINSEETLKATILHLKADQL